MFRFHNVNDFLEFDISIEDDKSIQSFMDASVSISFSAQGFSGVASSYILKEDMELFCRELLRLEVSRSGEAKLIDMSGDIEFIIKAIDLSGHMGIRCKLRGYSYLANNSEVFTVQGVLEIDSSQLLGFSKEWWISAYSV